MTLNEAIARLRAAGVDSPAYDARALFRRFGGFSDVDLFGADPDLADPAFLDALARRERREPLGYLLGEWGFYEEVYRVTPAVLIPRPETELLADYAVRHLPAGAAFLDLCTGSGCVALSVLLHTRNTRAVAADISADALAVAEENAAKYGLCERVSFRRLDVLSERAEGTFFAVLANPPYVKDAVVPTLAPEIAYEPSLAFPGGADGMDFYRAILRDYRDALPPDGFFAFEIGYDQKEPIEALARACGMTCEVQNDLAGLPRLAVVKPR